MKRIRKLIPKKLKSPLRGGLNRLAKKAGYERRRPVKPVDLKPVDFRGIIDDPLEALERANGQPVMLNIPGEDCRAFPSLAFQLTKNSPHPFIMTATNYISGLCNNYYDSSLYWYYQKFQPNNSAEILGLSEGKIARILMESRLSHILPWLGVPEEEQIKASLAHLKSEAKEHGFSLSGKDGSSGYGPVSNDKGKMEFHRLHTVIDSIQEFGFCPEKFKTNTIGGRLLMRRDRAKVEIRGAQHRAPVLAALGWNEIPVKLFPEGSCYPHPVVRRSSVSDWPGVRAGFFTEKQALNIFDRVFEGRQPPALERVWPSPEHY